VKRNERILLVILTIGVLVWLGRGPLTRLFYDPIEQLNSQIEMIDRQLAEQELAEIDLIAAARQMKSRKRLSLPADPLTAQRLYQKWLTDLALAAGFQELKVTPESRNETDKAFVAVQVRLNANATLEQIVKFLQEFQRTELLHRISSIDLDSDIAGRSPTIGVTLVAEGLALTTASNRNWLFAQSTLAESVALSDQKILIKDFAEFPPLPDFLVQIEAETLRVKQLDGGTWTVERGCNSSAAVEHPSGAIVRLIPTRALTADAIEKSAALVASNPFLRPTPTVASNEIPVENTSVIDEAQFTFLISAIADDDEREAWLFNRLNDSKRVIKEGDLFSVGGKEATVLKIQRDFVLVRFNNANWRLDVGNHLRSLRRAED
jgi:hypothetical protein